MEPIVFRLDHPCGFTISRDLAEAEIAKIDALTKRDMGTGYVWYSVPPADLNGSKIAIRLCFDKGFLDQLHLAVVTGEERPSWDGWSEERELTRTNQTENWLRKIGYPPGKYPWGEIWAEYDPKSGFGGGGVRYFG